MDKKIYKPGDKSKAICGSCKKIVDTEFMNAKVYLAGMEVPCLVGICIECNSVVSVPGQSVEKINLIFKNKRVPVDVPNQEAEFAELRFLVTKATQGPWWVDSHGHTMTAMESLEIVFQAAGDPSKAVRHKETGNLSCWRNDWDASYIAEANPETIQKLLARLDEEIQKRKELEEQLLGRVQGLINNIELVIKEKQ